MKINKKEIIVTCAFPYSNGSIHIGHLLEHIQADIWVRFNKLFGNKVYFICSDDTHGTAIMLKSIKKKKTPENIIFKTYKKHILDFKKFNIIYDKYYFTHNKENKILINLFFDRLKHNGYIIKKNCKQLYDIKKKIFLPDRFIKGKCPKCYSYNQYGDNCEICGAFYKSTELINPKSVITKLKPIIKKTKHYFLNLILFKKKINNWLNLTIIKNNILNRVSEWFKKGNKFWDISRNNPYFGFKIPKEEKKYFYVWFDALIGYIGTFKILCNYNKKINFDKFWNISSKTKLYHFIGKDIIYFHNFFWPSILEGSNLRKPTKLFIHGHITINKNKISKSKKKKYINFNFEKKNSDFLRYYYASKLSNSIKDIEFNIKNFIKKINNDIINKLINLISRNSSFINNYYYNKLSNILKYSKIYQIFINESKNISKLYINIKFNKIINTIMKLVDLANFYINIRKPWYLFKNKLYNNKLHMICTMGINLFKILITYLKPIMPNLTLKSEFFLNIKLTWSGIKKPLLGCKIKKFEKFLERI
ncbi:MAG: methionine--tRNA ligase [Enterobacteriaceae bacterium PSpicST2]|nr:MAG: methionine--tRNA ligase [Enterobacteriaceae bacterium PSpicST2]